MYRILKSDLPKLYAAISAKNDLLLPVKTAGKTNFALWTEDAVVDIEALKTVKSPKDAFFPQSENLYTCGKVDGKTTITEEERCNAPFVVFGIKGCDVRAIAVLDKVFLSEPVDSYYASRREHGVIVSMACNRPETSCFCGAFGIDCAQPEGDVVTWQAGEYLYWQPMTEKGEVLTQQVAEFLSACEDAPVNEAMEQIRAICNKLPLKDLDLSAWGAEAAQKNFDSPIWEQLYKPCLACGTCTFVCPTCQCYDIKDYNTGNGVQRYRCWDSCMYSDFTMMAHGNNRNSQMQRFRQRFMHKLAYFPANNDGMFSCVGCGRCVDSCPAHLNIVKVIKAFGKGEK
ncbi:MAG: 4Fe-4S dicluster domain-containing protein [Oscillospiraceae bacterium]|nr:4Fe-4S dicluster domain-containing protein [Oscillospiraceae bacterium]